MKDSWTDEPTRIHQYAPPAAGKGIRDEGDAHESSTVVENRESLLARVSASMAVPEGASKGGKGESTGGAFRLPGMSRAPLVPVGPDVMSNLPVSRDARPSNAAGVVLTFPFGHDDDNSAADRTPPPIQTRRKPDRPATGDALRTVPARSAGSRLGPHLPITVGIVASFVLGLALRKEPPRDHAPPPALPRAAAAAPLIQPRPAPATLPALAVVPARALLKITSSPPGAYVAVDNEVAPASTPREVAVGMGRWVTVKAQRPGFQPTSRAVYVQQATTAIDIPLEADRSRRPDGRR
jgi:hypothetical protein